MKNLISCCIIFLSTCESPNSSEGEDFSYINDSNLDDFQKEQYMEDACYLACNYMNQDSILKEQVVIPNDIFLTFYGGLIAVNNSEEENAKNVHYVHDYFAAFLKQITLYVDTTASWRQNWENKIIHTGVDQLDSLLSMYFSEIERTYSPPTRDYFWVTFRTKDYYNRKKLCSLIEKIDQNNYAVPDAPGGGDGSTISATLDNKSLYMIYSIGWGDCPAGCISRHFWEFKVSRNKVEFIKDYGD